MSRCAPVDGVRSIAHISLVCLHTAMLLTGKLPAEGALWDAFKSSMPFTFFQAGGIQVDIMFMLSGFLLVFNLMKKPTFEMPSLVTHTLRRALRMMPMMITAIILGHYVIKDCWGLPYTFMDGGKQLFPNRVMSYLLFYTNYCDQITHGSFLGSLMWSCAVELQVSILMLIIIKICAIFQKPTERVSFIRLLRVVFVVLFFVACLIRGSIFDKDKVNMVQLGQFFHFRLLQPRSSYTWMEDFFGHTWQTTSSAIDMTHEYLNNMYFPTHTRFGPFMVGGVVACCLLLAQEKDKGKGMKAQGVTIGTVVAWIFTGIAVVQLLMPCMPAPPIEEVPLVAQLFVTAALRNLSACAAGLLMYRAMVPAAHTWHSSSLSAFFSLSIWKHVAAISFCSYLVHFRLIMEVIYSVPLQVMFGLTFPAVSLAASATAVTIDGLVIEWLVLMLKVFVIGIGVSFVVAKVLHEVVEKPVARMIETHLFPRVKAADKEKKLK